MAETNVQALEKIFTEVDESQIKIIFSSQCIKAQAFLVDKLKKQTKHQKDICNFISNGNIKLEAEIKLAEQEIKNLIIAHDTIKLGNIELRKECLLKISEKLEIIERTNTGEKKYEQLWLESKSRFESIPFVQKYLQVKNRNLKIEDNIKNLGYESASLLRDIQIKKDELQQLDQKIIIDLAIFLVNQKQQLMDTIHVRIKEIKELNEEITIMEENNPNSRYPKLRKTTVQPSPQIEKISQHTCKIDNSWPSLSKNDNDAILMPKLQLQGMDIDILSVKLDQIRKVDLYGEQQKDAIMIDRFKNYSKGNKISDECLSSYFNDLRETPDNNNKSKNYSERKLIHILKDVKLENNQTLEIISKVDPNCLSNVKAIRSEITEVQTSENKVSQAMPIEKDVHEGKKSAELLVPPSQFLDERKNSQEKRVSFDISMEMKDSKETGNDYGSNINKNSETDETLNSIDDNLVSNEQGRKMQDKMIIEDNLDSSQFIYNEYSILHKMTQDNITSKFFDTKIDTKIHSIEFTQIEKNNGDDKTNRNNPESNQIPQDRNKITNDCSDVKMDKIILPKISGNDEKVELPVTGFLFNHGSQGVPDSLNLSESTQGFDDADGDFPHCIDSNILLSPKADITIEAVDDNVQVSSQELPSFISGVRKSGLGFFGWSSSDSKEKSNVENADSNFKFNFVGEEKKGRGGLFNMFR